MLIDADEAVKIIKRYDDKGLTLDEVIRVTDGIVREIEAMPTVDAEPVRHGKWEDGAYENSKKCLTCGKYASKIYKGNDPVFDYIICPYCGAKMEGE